MMRMKQICKVLFELVAITPGNTVKIGKKASEYQKTLPKCRKKFSSFVDVVIANIKYSAKKYMNKMCIGSESGSCRLNDLASTDLGYTRRLVHHTALPHISLLLAAICYIIVGSLSFTAFCYIDDRTDINGNTLIEMKESLIAETVRPRSMKKRKANLEKSLDNYAFKLHTVFQKYISQSFIRRPTIVERLHEKEQPKLIWNLFFAATALTSIGYGNSVSDSYFARLFIIVYIFIGIPLFIITLTDLAKFFNEFINRLYAEVLKHRIASRKLESHFEVPVDEIIISGADEEVAEFLWTHLENAHFVEVPFVTIYILLFVYVIAASYLISWIEGWSIYDGLYFIIVSMLTIGFGDLIPRNQSFILLTLFIVLLGLILATSFIDIVGSYYIDRLHFFGRNLDLEDSLEWLKKVQQLRLITMKREAMRKLFETAAALQYMEIDFRLQQSRNEIKNSLNPPRNLRVTNSTSNSIVLKWDPPSCDNEGKSFWYTVTYKISRNNPTTVIEYVCTERYVITGLRSFTLYGFSVATTTNFGSSKPITCYEYTEPCTVPQSLSLEELSSETATLVWNAPRKNIGPENYTVLLSQEPAPQFSSWQSYGCGKNKRFTVTELLPNTR
ncbi:TWiK family of potassium channels protein [Dirofilaria immitis]